MKRVLLAVFLIAFALVFALFSHFYIKNVSMEIEALLETALSASVSDGSAMSENAELVLVKWKKHGKFFGVLLKSSVSDEMDEAFCELEFFLNYQHNDLLSQAVTKCIFLLKSATEGEKFSFGNIF